MEYNSERLHDGLYMICRGELVGLIGLLAVLVMSIIFPWSMLYMPAIQAGTGALFLVSTVVSWVGLVVSLIGQCKLCSEHRDYKIALILTVIGFFLNLLKQYGPVFLTVVTGFVYAACYLGKMYFLIRATNHFLAQRGRDDLVKKGKRLLIPFAVCSVVINMPVWSIVHIGPLVAVAMLVSLLVIIITWVCLLRYLRQSADVFQ